MTSLKQFLSILDSVEYQIPTSPTLVPKPNPVTAIPVELAVTVQVPLLPLQDKPVDVPELHPSEPALDYKLLLSPVLPDIPAVLHLAVSPDSSPELGPLAALPVAPVTDAKMLVSKISTTAFPQGPDYKVLDKSKPVVDNPIDHIMMDDNAPGSPLATLVSPDPVLDNRPPIISIIPALKISVSGYKPIDPGICADRHRGFVILSTVEGSWSPVLRHRRRRPLRPPGVSQLPAAPPPPPRPPNNVVRPHGLQCASDALPRPL